ncbi:hypothetical protein BDY21DRAFT_281560 [Lineolata rhizophorae]|uniref:Pentatricopeptide repeat protein n=1 Tax=Lineolata rhizophorae TaxID=578093 RepID=A0A6A6P872_9PEZI|nr:hypothetical protein BDY21DRAFT_281560 [Lineolata rhizophorae]
MPASGPQKVLLKRFNVATQNATHKPEEDGSRKELWKAYLRAKESIPGFLTAIPDQTWDLLWKGESEEGISNPNSMAHLKTLVEDMDSIGKESTLEQRLAHLEAIFVEGNRQDALKEWEDSHDISGGRSVDGHKPEFLSLGIRMYAHDGNLDRAVVILQELLETYPLADPRAIISMVKALIRRGTSKDLQQAWALYQLLRQLLGTSMTMEDYDIVSLSFMESGNKDLALGVFRDMMLVGDRKDGPERDASVVQHQAMRHIQEMRSIDASKESVDSTFLAALAMLPRRFHNKWFYASWMKKLIGMGRPDAAAQVLELMFERGCRADAIHVNGIIGAWLRTGDTKDKEKAELMAWAMIQARLEFVSRRRADQLGRSAETTVSIPNKSPNDKIRVPRFLRRNVPQATIETFSVMLLHYVNRLNGDRIKQITDALHQAEIKMNSYFMNHVLVAEMRSRSYSNLWARYLRLSKTVRADVHTFTLLWDAMIKQIEQARAGRLRGYPTPRLLMRHMMTWLDELDSDWRTQMIARFTAQLYDRIIECFDKANDLPGSLVVMHAMHSRFGVGPQKRTSDSLVQEIARISFRADGKTPRMRREVQRSAAFKGNVQKVRAVLEMLRSRRLRDLEDEGVSLEDLGADELNQFNLNLFSELIRVVSIRSDTPDRVEAAIRQAKTEMNGEDLETGDRDSFQVS